MHLRGSTASQQLALIWSTLEADMASYRLMSQQRLSIYRTWATLGLTYLLACRLAPSLEWPTATTTQLSGSLDSAVISFPQDTRCSPLSPGPHEFTVVERFFLDNQARQRMTCHFNATFCPHVRHTAYAYAYGCMPDKARDGRRVALMWQLKWQVIHWRAWSSKENHSTINASMPNNCHDMSSQCSWEVNLPTLPRAS